MSYLWHLGILILIYTLLGMSLNLVVGYGGILSLCHAAFAACGAYVTALLMLRAGWPFLLALAAGTAAAAVLSFALARGVKRLRGDLFVLGTLAFQTVAYSVLYNWTPVTGGSNGLPGIPPLAIGDLRIGSLPGQFLLIAVLVGSVAVVLALIAGSPFGRVLRAVRDDGLAAQSLGKDPDAVRRASLVVGGAGAGLAGGLLAVYSGYIDPSSFTLNESVFMMSIVIIGGTGRMSGSVVGALVMVLLPELFRVIRIPEAQAANLRQVALGIAMVLLMRFRPQGIRGRRVFQ